MSLFSLDKKTKQVQLVQHPSDSGYPASAEQLIELFESSEFAEFEINLATITFSFFKFKYHQAPTVHYCNSSRRHYHN